MNIVWQIWSRETPQGALGHGIEFHDRRRPDDNTLIGFIDGFGWLHGTQENVRIYHIQPDGFSSESTIRAMKRYAKSIIASKRVPQDSPRRRITTWING